MREYYPAAPISPNKNIIPHLHNAVFARPRMSQAVADLFLPVLGKGLPREQVAIRPSHEPARGQPIEDWMQFRDMEGGTHGPRSWAARRRDFGIDKLRKVVPIVRGLKKKSQPPLP